MGLRPTLCLELNTTPMICWCLTNTFELSRGVRLGQDISKRDDDTFKVAIFGADIF